MEKPARAEEGPPVSPSAAPPGATDTAGPGAPSPVSPYSRRRIGLITLGLMLGTFLSALDQTIVATSMATIADDLKGVDAQAWVSTAYLVTLSMTTPLYGKLSDVYGRKPLFLGATSVFLLGSVACSFAGSVYQLAVYRGVQGLGAGGLVITGLMIIADTVPAEARPRYQGAFMSVYGLSSVVGPLLGGFFSGRGSILGVTGWRWVFLVNVPTGVVSLVLVAVAFKGSRSGGRQRVDWWGAAILPFAVVPVLIVAEHGGSWGWLSARSAGCYALGAVALVAFLLVERAMKLEALIPLRLFGIPAFRTTMVTAALSGVGMYGGIVLVPQYLQIVRGQSPTEAGLMTIPLMVGMMAAAVFSGGAVSRTGRYKGLTVAGMVLTVAGLALFATVDVRTPLWQPVVYMVVFGVGLGNCLQTLTVAAQNCVPREAMGLSTSLVTFFRQIGGSLGLAALMSVLFRPLAGNIHDAFVKAARTREFLAALNDPAVRSAPENAPFFSAVKGGGAGQGALSDMSFLQRLDPRLAGPFKEGFVTSISLSFLVAAGVAALGFVAAALLVEKRAPHTGSADPE
ncbi:MDR family MFS transporter [Streptomyces caatingaensis]|uniref:MDR family MFS transporter n=1 Tax=Streptomyces caatingaensis TaxID=1678637 RepID=UPI00099D0EC4|nr:MDR family MFS transporter [Streptomyces caatingaensis]